MGRALVISSFFLALAVCFLPVLDTDFGWHYRCGKEFLTSGKLCLKNEYSYFLPDYQWANPQFLYDISLAWVFDRFGLAGASALGALVMTAVFGLWFSLLRWPLVFRLLGLAAAAGLSSSTLGLGYRSQILGLLFFSGEVWLLERAKRSGDLRWLWLLPPLFLFWANAHPSFFLGPVVLFLFGASGRLPIKIILPVFLLSLTVTVLNPFGVNIYGEILHHLQSPLSAMIAEWVPPPDWQKILILVTGAGAFYLASRQPEKRDYRFLLLLLTAGLALSARRNLPLYYFSLLLFLLGDGWIWGDGGGIIKQVNIIALFGLIFGGLLAPGMITRTWRFDRDSSLYCQQGQLPLPCEAIDYFAGRRGNVFNAYEWGGFLIWKLSAMKVFADGRMPAWQDEEGRSPYQVYLEIIQARPGWNERLRSLGTDYLLIGPGTFLDLELAGGKATASGWSERYRDKTAVIYGSPRTE